MVLIVMIVGTVMFIMVDELVMSIGQRRIGPLNVGWYGYLAAVMNGLNLMITQSIMPVLQSISQVSYALLSIGFMASTVMNSMLMYPFSVVNVSYSYLVVVIILFLSLLLLMFIASVGNTKYGLIGGLRLISQYIGSELVFTSLIMIIIWTNYHVSIGWLLTSVYSFQSLFALFFIITSLICILADSNRVPFDIAEGESELVAGFLTEHSSIYFSLLLFSEYAGIIVLLLFLIITFHLVPFSLFAFMLFISLIRTSLARLKYDEMLISFWIFILPILFSLLMLCLLYL